MKKEYEDLSIEEKKEYLLLRKIVIDIPEVLTCMALFIFVTYICLLFKFDFLTSSICFFITCIYVVVVFIPDKNRLKKLFGL